uniref:Myb/SANT-like domain-containing protein n=1 Tax=Davidia involucrata TaxID=16924 RepID=A0A5B6Z0W6_DAVIN
MEHSGNSSLLGNSFGVTRRLWSKEEEEALLEGFHEICAHGWKLDNGNFRVGYISILENHMTETFPGTNLRGYPHIEFKIKNWKKSYNSISSCLATSGFTWNDIHKYVEIENDDIWTNYVQVCNFICMIIMSMVQLSYLFMFFYFV